MRSNRDLRNSWMGQAVVWLVVAASVVCATSTAIAIPVAGPQTPGDIVERISTAVKRVPSEEIEVLTASLRAFGSAAVPSIEEGLARGEERLSMALVRALWGIAGDGSTGALVRTLALAPSPALARAALAGLENRTVRRTLSSDEWNRLSALVREEDVLTAGAAARVLGKCGTVPSDDRVRVIVQRFRKEVAFPTALPRIRSGYVSPRVRALNQFLLGLSYVGQPAITALADERTRSAGNADLNRWLILALGMCGDTSVAGDLEQLVLGEPDRYVRCLAVRAYARSAKRDSIPLLRSLLTDPTESEYGSSLNRRVRLIARTAAAELFRLESLEVSGQQPGPAVAPAK